MFLCVDSYIFILDASVFFWLDFMLLCISIPAGMVGVVFTFYIVYSIFFLKIVVIDIRISCTGTYFPA